MKHETMKILFVIKKSSLLKNGEAPIVVRVTINGVSDEVRIQRSVLPRLWNQARGCCKGRDRVSIELNDYIESLKTKIHNLHKELLLEDALITPSHLLKRLFNKVISEPSSIQWKRRLKQWKHLSVSSMRR